MKKLFLCSLVLTLSVMQPGPALAEDAHADGQAAVSYPALTNEVLAGLITAEIATQRGQPQNAFELLAEQASQTGNPRLARRAFEVALATGNQGNADQALQIWKQSSAGTDAESLAQAFMDLRKGRLDDALPGMRHAMETDDHPVRLFNQILNCLSGVRVVDALPFLEQLAEPQLQSNASLSIVLCRLSIKAGNQGKAAKYARSAVKTAPGNANIAQKAATALMRANPGEAQAILDAFLQKDPDNVSVRLLRTRILLVQKKTELARSDLASLPESGLTALQWYQCGELWHHLQNFSSSRHALLSSLNAPGQNADLRDRCFARLGVLSELSKHADDAIAWYEKIQPGIRYVPAKLRIADIYVSTQRPDRAIAALSQAVPEDDDGKIKIASALSSLLDQSSQHWQAYEVMRKVAEEVEDASFLYDTAMHAEKVGDFSAMETYLRKTIRIDPTFAMAYNALGYTMADQNRNLDEALRLITRANELQPSDSYVLDSLGWVHYRLGNNDLAIRYLKESLAIKYHEDSAAHLVEALLQAGKREEAKEQLEKFSSTDPTSKSLRSVREKMGQP